MPLPPTASAPADASDGPLGGSSRFGRALRRPNASEPPWADFAKSIRGRQGCRNLRPPVVRPIVTRANQADFSKGKSASRERR